MANHLLNHEASVILTNDAGMDCIATAEHVFAEQHKQQHGGRIIRNQHHATTMSEWNDFIQELKRRETTEKARIEARDRARSQANEE